MSAVSKSVTAEIDRQVDSRDRLRVVERAVEFGHPMHPRPSIETFTPSFSERTSLHCPIFSACEDTPFQKTQSQISQTKSQVPNPKSRKPELDVGERAFGSAGDPVQQKWLNSRNIT